MYDAAKAPTTALFQEAMERIRQMSPSVADYLSSPSIPASSWAAYTDWTHDVIWPRAGHFTSNASECLNSALLAKGVRDAGPLTALQKIELASVLRFRDKAAKVSVPGCSSLSRLVSYCAAVQWTAEANPCRERCSVRGQDFECGSKVLD